MSTRSECSIIIPNYNDKVSVVKFVREVIDELSGSKNLDFEIIIVDDGSSDDSVKTLSEKFGEITNISVIQLYRNFGQQHALKVGLNFAQKKYCITIDGDGQTPASIIRKFLSKIEQGYVRKLHFFFNINFFITILEVLGLITHVTLPYY